MKKYLYLAAALLVAASCARETVDPDPVQPEEPSIVPAASIPVTLTTGSPDTRTELRLGEGNRLHPFWTSGDDVNVILIPSSPEDLEYDEEEDEYVYPENPFGITLLNDGAQAEFTGSVPAAGDYLAFYPQAVYDGEDLVSGASSDCYVGDDYVLGMVFFEVPTIQRPSATSFDPAADLLISTPFTVSQPQSSTIGTSFTRMNAIVKLVLSNQTGDESMDSQHVWRVSIGTSYISSGGDDDEGGYAPAHPGLTGVRTRASVYDSDENGERYWQYRGLSGDVLYTFGKDEGVFWDSYDVDEAMCSKVTAEYDSASSYTIGEAGVDETATYLIVVPCILENDEWGGDYYEGLYIRIETDDYLIERNIKLPEGGIALQPSCVTTLTVGLFPDGQRETSIRPKGLSCLHYDDQVNADLPVSEFSLRENEFEEFLIVPVGLTVHGWEDLDWSCEPDGVARLDFTETYYDGTFYDVRIWGEQASAEPATVTISAGGYSYSFTVHVSEASPIVEFEDDNARDICLERWDRNDDGFISQSELAAVRSLDGAFDNHEWRSYNYLKKEAMVNFNEFQYFTGLEELGENAFAQCISLKSIVLPPQLLSISESAFYNCNLESITLPAGVTSIEESAFEHCSKLTTVTLAENGAVTSIGKSAFEAAGLTNIDNLLAHATEVGMYAFKDCKFETVTLRPDATYGLGMLMQSSLQSVELPSAMTVIPDQFFQNCYSLTSVTFGANSALTEIGDDAFNCCKQLDIESLPSTLMTIGKRVFYNCEALSSLTSLPAGLTGLGDEAFVGTGLTEISIPSGITSLGKGVFYGCEALADVTLPLTLTALGEEAFRGCIALEEIVIPASVSSFGSKCFYGCTALEGIDIPSAVTSIGEDCFNGCTLLDDVTLPSGLTGLMPSGVFGGCTSLQRMVIPQGVTQLGSGFFKGCTSLSSVTIQGPLTIVGGSAFYGCRALTTLVIPGKLTSIGNSAFEGCTGLQSITFDFDEDAPYKYIQNRAFYGCTSLQSITIPDCLEYVNDYTFYNCTSLESVHLPANLTGIYDYAFYGCSALTGVELPSGVEVISNHAFDGCTSIHSIVFPAALTTLRSDAFYRVEFRSGNGYAGVKFLNSTLPLPSSYKANLKGTHWNGSGWATGVDILVPSGTETAYQSNTYITDNGNNTIVPF